MVIQNEREYQQPIRFFTALPEATTMADRPPVSVLLPTTRWTDACGELAAQLGDRDELLLIHDVEDDSITDRQHTPKGVRLIAAGEPEHCSGKANAIAGIRIATMRSLHLFSPLTHYTYGNYSRT